MRRPEADETPTFPLAVEVEWAVVQHLEGLLRQVSQQFPEQDGADLQAVVVQALLVYGQHLGGYIEAHHSATARLEGHVT
ncbi:MAG: hypothetical protein H6673_10035 [Anaerolineales bacterium]|nr:hypothetical protein [Anaerolineales bacterium]